MAEPFWKELIRQEDLEDQWDAMRDRGGDVDLDAFALARFAEARMYERARQVVERLEVQLAEARAATWPAGDEAAEQLARALFGHFSDPGAHDLLVYWREVAAAVLDRLNRQEGDADA